MVWAIADCKREGYLGTQEFITAMQLVSLAQAAQTISYDLLNPEFDWEMLSPLQWKVVRNCGHHQHLVVYIIEASEKTDESRSGPFKLSILVVMFCPAHLMAIPFVMGVHIGPEPTTQRFIVIMSGPGERSIPGNTVAVQADMPFSGLTAYGSAFLSKFECSQMPHPLLEHISFVDTPEYYQEKNKEHKEAMTSLCDLILLLFDPHKLDISDKFNRVIASLCGHGDKIRVVINKADQIDTQQGLWRFDMVIWQSFDVVSRVYIGSFNGQPLNEGATGPLGRELSEKEQDDLLTDLKDIPKKACDHRSFQINEFVKRARAAKIHAYITGHLKQRMPAMIGKAKSQRKLIDNLEDEFAKVQRESHLPAGDFPNVKHLREVLKGYNIDKFE
ncbi:hypothetical protein Ancab_004478 [Ancistrocladus abbreviatus]